VSCRVIKVCFAPRALSREVDQPNLKPRSNLGQRHPPHTRSFFLPGLAHCVKKQKPCSRALRDDASPANAVLRNGPVPALLSAPGNPAPPASAHALSLPNAATPRIARPIGPANSPWAPPHLPAMGRPNFDLGKPGTHRSFGSLTPGNILPSLFRQFLGDLGQSFGCRQIIQSGILPGSPL